MPTNQPRTSKPPIWSGEIFGAQVKLWLNDTWDCSDHGRGFARGCQHVALARRRTIGLEGGMDEFHSRRAITLMSSLHPPVIRKRRLVPRQGAKQAK